MNISRQRFRVIEKCAINCAMFAGFTDLDEIIVNFIRQPRVMHIPNNLLSAFPGVPDNCFWID
jgi:hypothetical protein